MLKSIIFCFLLCGFSLSEEQTLKDANLSVTTILHSRNLFTAKIDQQLYSLTWKNETHVEVFSTNQTERIQTETNQTAVAKKCTFDVRENPFKHINSSKILNTIVLSASNKVAVVGFRQRSSDGNYTLNYYDIFLMDLINCEHKMIKTAYLDKVPVSSADYQPQLIAYDDSFDVFFAGNDKECTPCRYDSKGDQIELKHKLKIDYDSDFNSKEEFIRFHISLLDSVDTSRNYFYIYYFLNGTSVMKILDQNFEVVKQRYVEFMIDFFSINEDVGAPIGICYYLPNAGSQLSLYCERLDFYLNPVLNQFSVIVPGYNAIMNATVTLDTLGNTFVGILHAPLNSTQRQLAVFLYDRYGGLAGSLDLRDIDNGETVLSANRTVELNSYIVEGMQGQYCIVAYEIRGAITDHHNTHIRCFQAPKDDDIY